MKFRIKYNKDVSTTNFDFDGYVFADTPTKTKYDVAFDVLRLV